MLIVQAALYCEIKALIKELKLKKVQGQTPFPLYVGEGKIAVVSSIGKIRAGAALAYCCTKFASSWAFCLNLGMAGHAMLPVGEGFLAGKVIDAATMREFYPGLLKKWKASPLITVDRHEKSFEKEAGYDMEASGFFEVGKLFHPTDHLFSYKIVSDNKDRVFSLSEKDVSSLFEGHMEKILYLLEDLDRLKAHLPQAIPDDVFEKYHRLWRFTFSEKAILKRLLERRFALFGKDALFDPSFEKASGPKELFSFLEV